MLPFTAYVNEAGLPVTMLCVEGESVATGVTVSEALFQEPGPYALE
jgi:hypothetical protein